MNFKPTDFMNDLRIDIRNAVGPVVMAYVWIDICEDLTSYAEKVYCAKYDIREALENELYICRNQVR